MGYRCTVPIFIFEARVRYTNDHGDIPELSSHGSDYGKYCRSPNDLMVISGHIWLNPQANARRLYLLHDILGGMLRYKYVLLAVTRDTPFILGTT